MITVPASKPHDSNEVVAAIHTILAANAAASFQTHIVPKYSSRPINM